jgi:hypothetical protein
MCIGEPFSIKLCDAFVRVGVSHSAVWNLYGPAETTIDCTAHLVNLESDIESIPLGKLLPRYQCLVLDPLQQPVVADQEGELFVGGVGVFAGYLGGDGLTAKALVSIDGELFYRTGDQVRLDHNGLLHYRGRKDHQVKLRGQRIELGEIEQCLLRASPTISACVLTKWGDDHLVAYVQSSAVDDKELREHCQSHLPPHMVPSHFVVLERLPLNANGKVDRKLLPSPDLPLLASSPVDPSDAPLSELEQQLRTVWCHVLSVDAMRISRTTNFFSVGGHSLLFIQLYYHYQSSFAFDSQVVPISLLLQQPTVAQHAQLLQTVITNTAETTRWCTLHLSEGENVSSHTG